jgi:inhibitor of cysteine peptidase
MFKVESSKKMIFISLAVLIVTLAVCSCKAESNVLTEKNNGDSIKLAVDDTVIIKLESNPTTGYGWILDEKTDTSIIAIVDSEYVQSEEGEELVGAGGHEIFTFKALVSGDTDIILNYERSWEEEEEPLETFEISISVE